MLDFICLMTNNYAIEKSANNWVPLTPAELRCFIAILLLSGYVQLPSYKMYWEKAFNVQHKLVRDAMSRNRFQEILRFIHFCDNSTIDSSDKCSKIRPLITMMQERCKKYGILTKILDIDESMIPYFGKFGQRLKQRMPMKPIRYGYKVWCLNLKGGYLYDFKVYQGKGSKNEFSDTFGLGPRVVLGLLKSLPTGNFSVYIDNYFVSIPLLKHLRTLNIGCTGTVRANMTQDCPLPSKAYCKAMEKATLKLLKMRTVVLKCACGMTMEQ